MGSGKHRVLDLRDLFVGVVPSLVHEVGVAGDRVDLAADLLEVSYLAARSSSSVGHTNVKSAG
mgnify:CR=1 FL=1